MENLQIFTVAIVRPQQLTVNSYNFCERELGKVKAQEAGISFKFARMTFCQPMWKTPILLLLMLKILQGAEEPRQTSEIMGQERKTDRKPGDGI